MAHCGYEATAADAMFKSPLQAMRVVLRGPRTEGPMAPEIARDGAPPDPHLRPAFLRVGGICLARAGDRAAPR
jgi:hypothetical protein